MKKIYLVVCVLLIITACRKDNSKYVTPDSKQESGDNRKCQLIKAATLDGKSVANYKYDLDSIIVEWVSTEDGVVDEAWYLHIENPTQFIFLNGSKQLEDAETRIYLNQDGSIKKEVAVTLNPDGLTFTEDEDQVNTFFYNSKKQLEEIEASIESVNGIEKGTVKFTYDEINRIKKIVFLDQSGKEILIYDNFSYDYHAKNDNLLSLDLFDSLSSHFIPSLRNVYIKGYRTYDPQLSFFTTVFKFNYSFTEGKLNKVEAKINILGQNEEVVFATTLDCK